MSYEKNKNIYYSNLKLGISLSVVIHIVIIGAILILNKSEVIEFKELGMSANTVVLDLTNLGDNNFIIEPGGSSGSGGGEDETGGGSTNKVNGIPVPSKTPDKFEFDPKGLPAPDSAKGVGLKPGEGLGNGNGIGKGSGDGKGNGIGNGSGDGTVMLSFTPRQILEVVPERLDKVKGIIKLSVRIGKEGLVKDHKVLQNTTDNSSCLVKVLEAVYKSRWQAVKIEGTFIEYWTEKTYRFE